MVMTVLEAHVPHERLGEVERVFTEMTTEIPPEIVETYLVRDVKDEALFRLVTIWRSKADLDAMRASGVKPRGVVMFEMVGAHPTLAIGEIVLRRTHFRAPA
jgi:heme-degrading monooxygenase HmoA